MPLPPELKKKVANIQKKNKKIILNFGFEDST